MTATQLSPWLTDSGPVDAPDETPGETPDEPPVELAGSGRLLHLEIAPALPVEATAATRPQALVLAPPPSRRGIVVTLDLSADLFGPGGFAGRGAPCRVRQVPASGSGRKPPFMLAAAPHRPVETVLVEPPAPVVRPKPDVRPAAAAPPGPLPSPVVAPPVARRETVPEMVARMVAEVEAELGCEPDSEPESDSGATTPTHLEAFLEPPAGPRQPAPASRVTTHVDPVDEVLPVQEPVAPRGGNHAARPGSAPVSEAPSAPDVLADGMWPDLERGRPVLTGADTSDANDPTGVVDKDLMTSLGLDATSAPVVDRPPRVEDHQVRTSRTGDPLGRTAKAPGAARAARAPRTARARPVLSAVLGLILGLLASAVALAAAWCVLFVLG